MSAKFALSLMTMILLVSLAGCATSRQSTATDNQASNNSQNNSPGTITDTTETENYQMLPVISGQVVSLKLDDRADGTTQQLKQGEAMSISLESNPSTGYSWHATLSNLAVLVMMGEPEYQAPAVTSTPLLGAPGSQTFYFQAVAAGTATLTLDYKRSWETDVTPEKTITITVEVH